MNRISISILFVIVAAWMSSAQESPIRYDFSGATAEANQVTLMGAGFGQYPQADVTFGAIPTDNAFENATDGRGMIVQADPGEGVMILTPSIQTPHCALIRCSVRISSPAVSIYLASIDQSESVYISTLTPTNPSSFIGGYQRIADFFLPPSSGFQGIIQILNTGSTETVTVYLDNLEILILDKDNIDLAVTEITGKESTPVATPTPVPPTPIPTPTPATTGETITVPLDLPSGAKPLEMVLIPAGTFSMGCPSTEQGYYGYEWPPHQVTLTKAFYLGQYEVTQAQYQAVMNSNPSYFSGKLNNPVECVTWYDAAKFCNELSRQKGLTPVYDESTWTTDWTANGFRLPTEAEWEYACRAGTQTRFYWGDDPDYTQIKDYCWYGGNNNPYGTKEVGQKLPNDFGLFDMSGNMWEWCHDWWQNPFTRNAVADPVGPDSGSHRVLRGGSWYYVDRVCRSAYRYFNLPDYGNNDVGFRVSRTP